MTATRTVLFTDLADYTGRVARSDREGLRRILQQHEAVVHPAVGRHGGTVVKNIGDSYLCHFPAATDAVRAALDIQGAHDARASATIRVALATGDVEDIDGDVFGEPVNLAARILEKTPTGEIWFGHGTRICMNTTEIAWESVGRFTLRGIPEEQECYRAVPEHRVWLPRVLIEAIKDGTLVHLRQGAPLPVLPPEPVVLIEGFEPGSRELEAVLGALPVLAPHLFYLATYTMASQDRQAWLERGSGLVVGTPEAIDRTVADVQRALERGTSDTASIDLGETMLIARLARADFELIVCGLALPRVPFSEIVDSYSYDLAADGQWTTIAGEGLLRVEVLAGGVRLHVLAPGIAVDRRPMDPGEVRVLSSGAEIDTPRGTLRFEALEGPYAGLVLADTTMRIPARTGDVVEIGRKPNPPGLAIPERSGQEHIRWCNGPRAAMARSGRFTLDRVLAGRRQASVRFEEDSVEVEQLHDELPTWAVRGKGLIRVRDRARLPLGALLVAGTTVVTARRPDWS